MQYDKPLALKVSLPITSRQLRKAVVMKRYSCFAKKEIITELRKQGNTYQEIADKLGFTHDQVEYFCRRNGLGYSKEEKQKAQTERTGGWNKGQIKTDWSEKVKTKTEGKFELVEIVETNDKAEHSLLIRCTTCGTEKTISSISLRGNGGIRCALCFHNEAIQRQLKLDLEKRKNRIKKDKRRIAKRLKEDQVSFRTCECGALLLYPKKVCDSCSKEKVRQRERAKEHKRRIREGKDFDKGITLDKLYERDHGVCYLCGKVCNWSDSQRINGVFKVGRSYPTVEHIKALANGGTHTWDNVKLACLSCNSKKGTKVYEDVAPYG